MLETQSDASANTSTKRPRPKSSKRVTPVKKRKRELVGVSKKLEYEPKESLFYYVQEPNDTNIMGRPTNTLSGLKKANGDILAETNPKGVGDENSDDDSGDGEWPPKRVITDLSEESEQQIVKVVNDFQVPFHDCAFYPRKLSVFLSLRTF